jgi:hypothetical protein
MTDLARRLLAAQAWPSYRSDSILFAGWLTWTTGDILEARTLTGIHMRGRWHPLPVMEM